jgi:hypothetical protein
MTQEPKDDWRPIIAFAIIGVATLIGLGIYSSISGVRADVDRLNETNRHTEAMAKLGYRQAQAGEWVKE